MFHLLIIEELLATSDTPQPPIKFFWLPQAIAFVYYQLSWLLFVLRPSWSYRLNADFEDHAVHEYLALVAEHPEWEATPFESEFADDFGHFESLADVFRQIGHDELVHKIESEDLMKRGRFHRDALASAPADAPEALLPCQDGAMSTQRRGQNSPRHGASVAGVPQDWTLEVAKSAAADAGGVDSELLGDFLARLSTPGPGHDWDRHTDATFAALGARAAERGVALRALVDLYLSAAWRAWPQLPAVAGEDTTTVRAAGQRVLRACDDAVAALAEGYTAARRAVVRRDEAMRREFVDDLLAGTADPAGLLVRAQSYGLQLAGAHAVLLARTAAPFQEASPLLTEVSAALAGPLGGFEALITTRDGELVVVLPALPAQALDAVLAAVHRGLISGDRRTPKVWMVLGRPHPGPSGVARSFTEARDALALAERLQLPQPVVHAEDLLVYQVLLRDRAALCDLIDTVLTPLRRARGGAGPLLETLEAYLGCGGNTTRTAHLLHLSVRAVTYRLNRITTLTSLHLDNPAHRYTLHTAVLGARALGWPANTVAEPRQ